MLRGWSVAEEASLIAPKKMMGIRTRWDDFRSLFTFRRVFPLAFFLMIFALAVRQSAYIDPDLFEKSSKRDWLGKPDEDPSTWRRSLYVFSKRSIRYPMFETFDQPNLINSIDRRNRTTIAPQALILMNNQMVLFQAGKFAERVRSEAGADALAQVKRAVYLALGRPADAVELKTGVAFVKESADGLTEFCHILLNLNEFLYRP